VPLFRLVQSRLRLVDSVLAAFALLLPGRLFFGFLALAALPLPFVPLRGLPTTRLTRSWPGTPEARSQLSPAPKTLLFLSAGRQTARARGS
jgi:hypothetical protein